MKALSIRQPWAWAIFNAGKDVENRNWQCKLRGRVVVHAAKAMTRPEFMNFQDVVSLMTPQPPIHGRQADELVFGALIGTVEIVDCVTSSTSPWFFGEFGFVLREPRLFQQPIPWRGSLGFFNVPDAALPQAA